MEPLATAQHLRRRLDEAGVSYLHWKSNLRLEQSLAGETDLDLLIVPGDAGKFRAAVKDLEGLAIVSQPWARYPEVEDWLLFDVENGVFLHLHAHFAMVTGLKRVKHLRLPWANFMFRDLRRTRTGDWPIPSPEMELLTLLVRIWAKMPPLRRLIAPQIPSHVLAELQWLEAEVDPDKLQALTKELGLQVNLPLGEPSAIVRQARNAYATVRLYQRMPWLRALATALGMNLRLAATRFWLRYLGPVRYRKTLFGAGAMVALIGSDGAGKSTLSAGLEKWLCYKLDVHLLYMGSGDGRAGLVNDLRRRLAANFGIKRNALRTHHAEIPRPAGFAEKLYRLLDLLLLRRKLRLLRKARRLAEGGSVILLDRYPQQQFQAISDGPRQQNGRGFAWAARQEMSLFDEAQRLGPDLVLKLVISAEAAQARKPDHDLETLRRKCSITDAMQFAGAETVILDAGKNADAVALVAKRAVWAHLCRQARP